MHIVRKVHLLCISYTSLVALLNPPPNCTQFSHTHINLLRLRLLRRPSLLLHLRDNLWLRNLGLLGRLLLQYRIPFRVKNDIVRPLHLATDHLLGQVGQLLSLLADRLLALQGNLELVLQHLVVVTLLHHVLTHSPQLMVPRLEIRGDFRPLERLGQLDRHDF
mgnify:CR=1 FL=1